MKLFVTYFSILTVIIAGCARVDEWTQDGAVSTERVFFETIGNPLERELIEQRALYLEAFSREQRERWKKVLEEEIKMMESALPEMRRKWEEFRDLSGRNDRLYFVSYLEDREYVLVRDGKRRASIEIGGSNFEAGKITLYETSRN